jgi:methionine-S-sulfoxide reductase
MTEAIECAVLAGGCFWGVQELVRKLPGVISTRVGYTGGDVPNATYRSHATHAEAIEILFDPSAACCRDLLELFLQIHDPTTKNPQGNDVGLSYRSAIYYTSDEQLRVCRGDDCRRGRVGPVAGHGRHRGGTGWALPGGRTRASGLPAAVPRRLHVPLRPAELEAAPPPSRVIARRRGLHVRAGPPRAPHQIAMGAVVSRTDLSGLAPARRQSAMEVLTGSDPELREHLPQMPFNGAGTEVELRANLRIGATISGEPRDLLLLGGELSTCVISALAHRLASSDQLTAGALSERFHTHRGEHAVSGA